MKHRIWDLPLRLFHWTLVVLVGISIYTGEVGGFELMDYHQLAGYAVLTLLGFRILWGFAGSTWSRFASFVKPTAILPYLRSLVAGTGQAYPGHNPLGGLSVLAMLLALLTQAGTGLFANDDIMVEGPLVHWVSEATSDLLTRVHHYNSKLIYVLLGLHLLAIAAYELLKKERLILPMITGKKAVLTGGQAPRPLREAVTALLLLAASAAATYYLVNHL